MNETIVKEQQEEKQMELTALPASLNPIIPYSLRKVFEAGRRFDEESLESGKAWKSSLPDNSELRFITDKMLHLLEEMQSALERESHLL